MKVTGRCNYDLTNGELGQQNTETYEHHSLAAVSVGGLSEALDLPRLLEPQKGHLRA